MLPTECCWLDSFGWWTTLGPAVTMRYFKTPAQQELSNLRASIVGAKIYQPVSFQFFTYSRPLIHTVHDFILTVQRLPIANLAWKFIFFKSNFFHFAKTFPGFTACVSGAHSWIPGGLALPFKPCPSTYGFKLASTTFLFRHVASDIS